MQEFQSLDCLVLGITNESVMSIQSFITKDVGSGGFGGPV